MHFKRTIGKRLRTTSQHPDVVDTHDVLAMKRFSALREETLRMESSILSELSE